MFSSGFVNVCVYYFCYDDLVAGEAGDLVPEDWQDQ